MTTFLQLHLLVSYPPSNLNRDDLGRPKTAIFGGSERLRISSQALKRAWRTSPHFDALREQGHVGERTRRLGVETYEAMCEQGIDEERARAWSTAIAKKWAKTRSKNANRSEQDIETEQLIHVSPFERAAIRRISDKLVEQKDSLDEKAGAKIIADESVMLEVHKASDIAMFGRMLADNPSHNVEAAVQVAHALTTHEVIVEDDFFSAVDDLNVTDSGAGHIGEAQFGSGIFYVYVNIDQDALVKNLDGDVALAQETLEALVRSCAQVGPGGKQNSYGSRCYAHYILAERADKAPRQLSLAFIDGDILEDGSILESTSRLEELRGKMDGAYGAWAQADYTLNVLSGEGKLEELVDFARGGLHG